MIGKLAGNDARCCVPQRHLRTQPAETELPEILAIKEDLQVPPRSWLPCSLVVILLTVVYPGEEGMGRTSCTGYGVPRPDLGHRSAPQAE